jgi:rRNA-processing protein FCF1
LPENQPVILLDQSVSGLADFIRDMGLEVVRVKDALSEDENDDLILNLARSKGYVVVTPDRKLAKSCKAIDVKVIELGMEDFAKRIRSELIGLAK